MLVFSLNEYFTMHGQQNIKKVQFHCLLILKKKCKIYVKNYIKIAPTCFGPRPSSGSLHVSLAKVILTLKQSVKLRRYVLCGGVAACLCPGMVCVLCAVLGEADFIVHLSVSERL
jgi:hypothetical protein